MNKANATHRVFTLAGFGVLLALPVLTAGCDASALLAGLTNQGGTPTGLAAEVATKADQVAQGIGGTSGFGGTMMNGYLSQMPAHMGFHDMNSLADPNGQTMVVLRNDSSQDATFRMAYMSSPRGLADQMMEVTVPAGSERTVEMPCSEIVGLGSLTLVGDAAAQLADGTQLDNRMCVPGFLGTDFQCNGPYGCYLAPDVNDLDGDGNTQELIVSTEALQSHMNMQGMGMGGSSSMMKGSTQP